MQFVLKIIYLSFNYCSIYSQLENTFVGEKHIHSYFLYVLLNILVYNAIHKYYFIVTFKKDKYFNYFRLMIALYFSYPLYHLEIVSYSKSGGLVFTFCQFIYHFMFIALKILCKFSRSRVNFFLNKKSLIELIYISRNQYGCLIQSISF